MFSVRLWTCLAQLTNIHSRVPAQTLARKFRKHDLFRALTLWLIQIKTMSCTELIFFLLIIAACDWRESKIIKQCAEAGTCIYKHHRQTECANRMICFTVQETDKEQNDTMVLLCYFYTNGNLNFHLSHMPLLNYLYLRKRLSSTASSEQGRVCLSPYCWFCRCTEKKETILKKCLLIFSFCVQHTFSY